jgi:hypothetical protein
LVAHIGGKVLEQVCERNGFVVWFFQTAKEAKLRQGFLDKQLPRAVQGRTTKPVSPLLISIPAISGCFNVMDADRLAGG